MRKFDGLTLIQMVRKFKYNGYPVRPVIRELRNYKKNYNKQCGFVIYGTLVEHHKPSNTYSFIL